MSSLNVIDIATNLQKLIDRNQTYQNYSNPRYVISIKSESTDSATALIKEIIHPLSKEITYYFDKEPVSFVTNNQEIQDLFANDTTGMLELLNLIQKKHATYLKQKKSHSPLSTSLQKMEKPSPKKMEKPSPKKMKKHQKENYINTWLYKRLFLSACFIGACAYLGNKERTNPGYMSSWTNTFSTWCGNVFNGSWFGGTKNA